MDYTQFVLTIIAVCLFGILFEMHSFISWIMSEIRIAYREDDEDEDNDDKPKWQR